MNLLRWLKACWDWANWEPTYWPAQSQTFRYTPITDITRVVWHPDDPLNLPVGRKDHG